MEPECAVITQPDTDEDWRVPQSVNGSPAEFKIELKPDNESFITATPVRLKLS